MNKTLFFATLLAFALTSSTAVGQTSSSSDPDDLNMIKFNVLSLLGGKFAFDYERSVAKRITVGATISLRPSKGIPFGSTVKKLVDDEELDDLIDNFKTSNFSITPEFRFYPSKRGTFRGFYFGPYVKYATYSASLPFDFDVDIEDSGMDLYSRTETIPLKGNTQAFTAGLSFGVNFKLSDKVHLDWRILGPGYGTSKGSVSGHMSLDTDEQAALRESMENLKDDLGDLPLGIKVDYAVNNDGAEVKILKSPWASIRSGLSIGYRF